MRFFLGLLVLFCEVGCSPAGKADEAEKKWLVTKAKLEAEGVIFDLEEMAPPPVPDIENFAKHSIVAELFDEANSADSCPVFLAASRFSIASPLLNWLIWAPSRMIRSSIGLVRQRNCCWVWLLGMMSFGSCLKPRVGATAGTRSNGRTFLARVLLFSPLPFVGIWREEHCVGSSWGSRLRLLGM